MSLGILFDSDEYGVHYSYPSSPSLPFILWAYDVPYLKHSVHTRMDVDTTVDADRGDHVAVLTMRPHPSRKGDCTESWQLMIGC